MTILNCPICKGNHFGSIKCPFILKPCIICKVETILACSDCAINSGGKLSIHICENSKCRKEHEINHEI